MLDKIRDFIVKLHVKSEKSSGANLENQIALENFLNDDQADLGTGLLAKRGSRFCFSIKQPQRWIYDDPSRAIIPFGGIGGKIEPGESPVESLQRESLEEVSSELDIPHYRGETFLVIDDTIKRINLKTKLGEAYPLIIFRSPRAESGRKPYTNVLIYNGRFLSDNLTPLDDPAIAETSPELLIQLSEQLMTVEKFRHAGGKITSRIDLPENAILKPIGTALAAAKCFKAGAINPNNL